MARAMSAAVCMGRAQGDSDVSFLVRSLGQPRRAGSDSYGILGHPRHRRCRVGSTASGSRQRSQIRGTPR
ncbi:hypothetical protein SDC9_195813 [bioreactor metagenome]|uniref:Uncharacterized protein n=1 Tax=bioreactor metagenome TaxID=1076179 RepID=A0A645IAC0_9ZZZZ